MEPFLTGLPGLMWSQFDFLKKLQYNRCRLQVAMRTKVLTNGYGTRPAFDKEDKIYL
jgi:hypothetical protein